MHADIGVDLAVYRKFGGDIHIGVIEIRQLLLPVRVLEFQEERAQRLQVVQRLAGVRLDRGRLEAGPRRGRSLRTAESASTAEPPASAARLRSQILPRGLSFGGVQVAFAILVELRQQFDTLARTAGTARTPASARAAKASPKAAAAEASPAEIRWLGDGRRNGAQGQDNARAAKH